MSTNKLIIVTCCLAVVLLLQAAGTAAVCNVCSPFGIACINETHFNMCEGNIPQTSRAFACDGNKQCSDTKAKCVAPQADVAPTCQLSTKTCGVCDGTKLFVCTSRTSYVQCEGATATDVTGTCSRGLVCDSQSGELCKNECTRPSVLECDREMPF